MEVLGFHVKVERYPGIWKHICDHLFIPKKDLRNTRKSSTEHAGSVCLVSHSALFYFVSPGPAWRQSGIIKQRHPVSSPAAAIASLVTEVRAQLGVHHRICIGVLL